MKAQIKHYVFITFFALLMFTSCQDEATELIEPDGSETLVANSGLANLMFNVSANPVARDNVLDNSNCFSVELPVTIVIGGITITITTEEDLEDLEDLLDEFEGELPDFVFPITIIYSDYTELVIENQDQLEAILDECFDDDDTIECVDFVYPISFSVFDSEFIIIDTVTIEDREALYHFLEQLEDEADTLIVGLNFPVELKFFNGETIRVDSNQELSEAIQRARDICDDDTVIECGPEEITAYLKECSWIINDEFDDFRDLVITFNEDGTLIINDENLTNEVNGTWNVELTDNGTFLNIRDLSAFQGDLGGEWLILECEEDEFEIIKGDFEIELERNCETDINCSAQDLSQRLRACYWFANSNLLQQGEANKLKFNENNTVMYFNDNTNAFENIGTWEVLVIGMERKLELDIEEPFHLLTAFWTLVECNDGFFSFQNGENVLMLEQECFNNNNNPFDCFEGMVLEACDDSDGSAGDQVAIFDLTSIIEEANCQAPFTWSFHTTVADAESNINAIESPNEYLNQNSAVILRIEKESGDFQLYDIGLQVVDCNSGACTEEDVDAILMECQWKISAFNGDDNLIDYRLDFNVDQELIITNLITNDAITANWLTIQGNDGVVVQFDGVNAANIQTISGDWTVVECTGEQLILYRGNDEIALDRICD
jgi:RNA recognition motif-containing protein